MFVMNESHNVKNIDKDSWKIIAKMKKDKFDERFWFIVMFDTLLIFDLTNIVVLINIISSSFWKHTKHSYHNLRLEFLKAMRKIIDKFRTIQDQTIQEEVKKTIDVFKQLLSTVLIRRHENSRWFEERLLDLKSLHCLRSNSKFFEKYLSKYSQMITNWKKTNLEELKVNQVTWDTRKHDKSYIRSHFERSTSLKSDDVFDIVRMLRLCINLLYLTVADSQLEKKIRWTNDDVKKTCMKSSTSRLRAKCSLIDIYNELVKNCSKLKAIAQILSNSVHRGMSILIMSIFFEMSMMIKRVSRRLVSTLASFERTSSDILFA